MEQAKARLEALLAQAPKREDFQSEADFSEATLAFQHRAGPVIRILQSLVSPPSSASPVSET
jgi:hypothetical protein